ncbi:MAG: hypothetical protein LC104_13305 [Bacteroidales bacterium]|nr:hypothetical protein [Bacteroidales bacterium]
MASEVCELKTIRRKRLALESVQACPGIRVREVAALIGCSIPLLSRWRKEDAEFREAWDAIESDHFQERLRTLQLERETKRKAQPTAERATKRTTNRRKGN